MTLKTFSDKAPAPTINAKDLDDNFRRLRPIRTDGNPRHYIIDETPDGWSIRVLPNFPSGAGPFLLGLYSGQLYWTKSGVDEPDTGNDGSVPNPPASGTYVLGSINGVVQWLQTEAC
jgi:hypothetical protein